MTESTHIISPRTFIGIWLLLLILTAVTVGVSRIDLGPGNVWTALGIASVKAGLVIFYFMHLKYERPLLKLGLLTTLVILAIFIGFTFFDTLYR